MRVSREDLLNNLESVLPGLSKREIVEQSSCFVFTDGRVMTYNDEIACSHKNNLDIEGAVQAEPLLAILRKLAEDEIDFTESEGELRFKGQKRQGGVRMEQEVLLPIETVEQPEKWRPLPSEFSEGVALVERCAGKDESNFSVTCVHIYPKWVEAYDNLQVARYKMKTGVKEPTLVRRNSIKHIHALDMTEFSESPSWLHFKNPAGLVLSCRRYMRDELDAAGMLNVSDILKFTGEKTILPKGLADAAEKAEIFSSDNSDENLVTVDLKRGKLRITGRGVSGWYQETKSVKYDGRSLTFRIDPKLLGEITNRHNECEITKERLKVDSKKFVYVTCLGADEEKRS